MQIAVLSGKGGAGKTLVSVNLAAVAEKSAYLDCDVEEPNGYLFFRPKAVTEEKVSITVPQVEHELCNGCRQCIEFCKFNALVYINARLVIFDEVCHACGGCSLVCPANALTEKAKVIGKIFRGSSRQVEVYTGVLNIGEASGIPIVKKLFTAAGQGEHELVVIDCPPGSACLVMESIKKADYCILVAEPTLFGVHNLNMVYELVRLFNKPFGVILNKCLPGKNPAEKFCAARRIKILSRIFFDRELGSWNAHAEIAVNKNEKYRALFSALLAAVIEEVRYETAVDSKR